MRVRFVLGAVALLVSGAACGDDGATASLRFSGQAAASTAIAAGTVLSVTVVAAGWLLSAAGEVICLIPNALGESLLYNERLR